MAHQKKKKKKKVEESLLIGYLITEGLLQQLYYTNQIQKHREIKYLKPKTRIDHDYKKLSVRITVQTLPSTSVSSMVGFRMSECTVRRR
jgi:hypothetical protein